MADPEGLNDSWRDDLSGFWFELLLTGCEILTARGGHQEVVRETLKRLVDPTLTRYEQIPLFNPTRIVILLRARALKERLDGVELTAESFLGIANPDKEGKKTFTGDASSQPYDERREEALRFFRACTPFFDRRGEQRSACTPPGTAAALHKTVTIQQRVDRALGRNFYVRDRRVNRSRILRAPQLGCSRFRFKMSFST